MSDAVKGVGAERDTTMPDPTNPSESSPYKGQHAENLLKATVDKFGGSVQQTEFQDWDMEGPDDDLEWEPPVQVDPNSWQATIPSGDGEVVVTSWQDKNEEGGWYSQFNVEFVL